MTTEINSPDEADQMKNDLWAKDKFDHTKAEVTLRGGYCDGMSIAIQNGVEVVNVEDETEDGKVNLVYTRSVSDPLFFDISA